VSIAITIAVGLLFVGGAIYLTDEASHGYMTVAGHHININDSLYLGTFSRAGGLMLGAGFATLWRPMAILRGPLRHKAARVDLVAAIGLVATLAMMGTMYLTEQGGSVYNPWLYRGGFFAVGITSLMMIAGATHQLAKTGSVLGNKVFLWIGTRSYGLYLFHWPVYQFIRKQADIEMSLAQIGVAMAITLPVTELSYRFIETPIRAGRLGEVRNLFTASGAHVMASISVVAMLGTAVYSLGSADPHCVGRFAARS
jgi:peptidoglycan/LPS O-acetylase OafA/YrhL